ncbi:MAG: cell division protein FtsA [Thermodesulfovibrionia bacterium]
MKRGELIVTLDVGSTKTCVLVAEVYPISSNGDNPSVDLYNRFNIIGMGVAPSKGIKKGVVVNIEEASGSIRRAVEEAGSRSGVDIKAVYTSIKGRHIEYINSHGVVAIRGREVTDDDVQGAVDSAKAVAIPFDRRILHVITKGFSINGQNGIYDPRGMQGVRLEADVGLITADAMSVHNLMKACERAGFEVIDIVFEPLATSTTILSEEERGIGVGLIDTGGGTTDIALFHEGSICYTSIIPVGGINFTHDISMGLRTLPRDAEDIKKRCGLAMVSLIKDDEEIDVGYSDERPVKRIPKGHLIEIIQPRAEELLCLIRDELRKSGYYGMMAGGIVLTGGGALLNGIDVMAENILELPVRMGSIRHGLDIPDDLNNPAFTSSIGLLLYNVEGLLRESAMGKERFIRGIIARLRNIIKF